MILAVAAIGVMIGTVVIDRSTTTESGPIRPERRIGDQSAGRLITRRTTDWTPARDPNGYAVSIKVPPTDSRIARFADFPVLMPAHLPEGYTIESVILSWDPGTGKRLIQIAVQGEHGGLITEQRLRKRDADYPVGIYLHSERQPDGNIIRVLQSNVNGVGISMAWSSLISDENLIEIYRSLKPLPQS